MKIGWCIPESQHSWIYFQSNLHSEFAVLLKFVYWIVMVSLLFPHFQGPARLVLTCLHHFPCAPSCGPLFLHCQCLSPVGQPNLHALAHSAHCSCQIPTISFRHSLSALFSKPYQWLHWRVHWWPGWAVFPLAAFPFYSHTSPSPAYSLFFKWMVMSWDTGYLFGLCLEKQQWCIPWSRLWCYIDTTTKNTFSL